MYGSMVIAAIQWFRAFCVLSVLKYFFWWAPPPLPGDCFQRRIYGFPFAFAWYLLVYTYYDKTIILKIIKKYESVEMFSKSNIIKVVVISLLPLIFGICMVNIHR